MPQHPASTNAPGEPEEPTGSSVDDLAASYLARRSEGGDPDPSSFRDQLTTDDLRREFDELLELADTASRVFPMAHDSGQLLSGRYRLLREIGGGALGEIWVALDERDERRVALVVLKPQGAPPIDVDATWELEQRLLAELRHPGIAAAQAIGSDGERRYLVLDLVEGPTVAAVIGRLRGTRPRGGAALAEAAGESALVHGGGLIDPSSWYRTVASVVVEALRALEAAHAQGVLHGDLSTRHIVLGPGARPVLFGFGLGTGRPGGDAGSDVQRMGAVLCELATLSDLPACEVDEPVRPRDGDPRLPRQLEDICRMAMDRDPARRYASAAAMRADLERYLGGAERPAASRRRTARRARELWRALVRRLGRWRARR